VIPLYNEADNLEILASEIRAAMEPGAESYEVLFVDDGSTDSSPEVLRRLAAEDSRVRVLQLRRNCGQSAALAAGFRHANGAAVVTLDADLQNDPADIPRLLHELENFDLISGVRSKRHDSWLRRMSSRIANRVRDAVIHDSISDVGCSLKAFRTEYLRHIPMFTGMHRFLPALLQLEGARVKEVPVGHRPRIHGETKYNIRNRLWKALADLFAVRWMQARWLDRTVVEEVEPATKRPPG
jgi:glycosyltransferase involved in cell wall biosynthesis